jgi:hypothetical protein
VRQLDPVVCDDGNACTDDSCNPSDGSCVYTNDDSNTCSDGNACTQNDSCDAGTCVSSTPVVCDDGNACTDDSCNPADGSCDYTNDDSNTCSDGNACTQNDACDAGTCVGSTPVVCNDGNACTDDSCNPADGSCDYTNDDSNTCSDGNACTQNDACDAGTCVGSNPVVCNDGNACTDDSCNPADGSCVYANDDSNSCNDGVNCTQNDACNGGTCQGTPVICNSPIACSAGSCNEGNGQCEYNGVCGITGTVLYYRNDVGSGSEPSTKPGVWSRDRRGQRRQPGCKHGW